MSVRSGARLVVGGIVVVAVVAASVWLAVAILPRDDSGTPTPDTFDHPGVTRSIPPAPLPPRSRPHAAWTGDELLVWSGAVPGEADRDGAGGGEPFEVFTDGAAYDRLVVWGGFGSPDEALHDGAVYLPEQDTWLTLPPAPITARGDVTAAWTGQEVLFVGGAERTGRFARVSGEFRDGAAYDPVADRWRRIDPVPDGVWTVRNRGVWPIRERFTAAWTGHELFVWGRDVALYEPAGDDWRRVGRSGVDRRRGADLGWVGGRGPARRRCRVDPVTPRARQPRQPQMAIRSPSSVACGGSG